MRGAPSGHGEAGETGSWSSIRGRIVAERARMSTWSPKAELCWLARFPVIHGRAGVILATTLRGVSSAWPCALIRRNSSAGHPRRNKGVRKEDGTWAKRHSGRCKGDQVEMPVGRRGMARSIRNSMSRTKAAHGTRPAIGFYQIPVRTRDQGQKHGAGATCTKAAQERRTCSTVWVVKERGGYVLPNGQP